VLAPVLVEESTMTEPMTAPTTAPSTARTFELPDPASEGPPREVRVLLDDPSLRIVSILLRHGTELPEHKAAGLVTIEAWSGAGHVRAQGLAHRIDARHAVTLPPGVPHTVVPEAGTNLLLLVNHHGRPAPV
jgi:quercetin dioxygenase-like cupin family protein